MLTKKSSRNIRNNFAKRWKKTVICKIITEGEIKRAEYCICNFSVAIGYDIWQLLGIPNYYCVSCVWKRQCARGNIDLRSFVHYCIIKFSLAVQTVSGWKCSAEYHRIFKLKFTRPFPKIFFGENRTTFIFWIFNVQPMLKVLHWFCLHIVQKLLRIYAF